MNEKRNHHYMPQFLLRRFADGHGRIHVFNKQYPDKGLYSTNPRNAFAKRDLYSSLNKDGTLDAGLEEFYGELEDKTAPLVEKIVSAALLGKQPNLNRRERYVWYNFTYHQHKRQPDRLDQVIEGEDFEARVARLIKVLERARGRALSKKESEAINSPETLQRMKQNCYVNVRGKGCEEIIRMLAQRGIAIAVIPNDKWSFIIGDYPHARMGATSDLHEATTELWMPIDTKVAVSPGGATKTETLISFTHCEQVRRINKVIYQQSNMVAGCARELVTSLARYDLKAKT
ncbi:MAG: DUF4238 domain-containing protein [Hyphomicrobiaceae bacterium]|nr:DUF4238 domain-containing protein [Hyphomicrobiaceae bacterium]